MERRKKKNVSQNVLMSKTRETLYREGLEKQLRWTRRPGVLDRANLIWNYRIYEDEKEE